MEVQRVKDSSVESSLTVQPQDRRDFVGHEVEYGSPGGDVTNILGLESQPTGSPKFSVHHQIAGQQKNQANQKLAETWKLNGRGSKERSEKISIRVPRNAQSRSRSGQKAR